MPASTCKVKVFTHNHEVAIEHFYLIQIIPSAKQVLRNKKPIHFHQFASVKFFASNLIW